MKYFLHDSNAMQDEKIAELYINYGYTGTGLFFAILEKIAFAESPVSEKILLFQLKIKGKKLLKIYSFLFEIELLFKQKEKVFNENVLKVAQKYKIKKEITRKRVSDWRENQASSENVTHYKSVRNAYVTLPNKSKVNKSKVNKSKVNKSKVNKEVISYDDFIINFNKLTGKKIRVLSDKVKSSLNARIKEGFTIEEIYTATKNCKKDKYHIENPKYLTPEFITRSDKLQTYLNTEPPKVNGNKITIILDKFEIDAGVQVTNMYYITKKEKIRLENIEKYTKNNKRYLKNGIAIEL